MNRFQSLHARQTEIDGVLCICSAPGTLAAAKTMYEAYVEAFQLAVASKFGK